MININEVVLVGRLTKDLEPKHTNDGLSYVRFTLAVNRQSKDDKADFIACTAWRQSADYLCNYAKKGDLIGLKGHITTGSYTNADGQTVYTTEVTADNVSMMSNTKKEEAKPQQYREGKIADQATETFRKDDQHYMNEGSLFNTPVKEINPDELPFY